MRIVILVLLVLAGRPALAADLLAWDAAAPDGGWSRWYPRPALAPGFAVDRGANQPSALRLSGLGNPHVFGGWRRLIPVEAGRSYRLHAEAEARGVVDLRLAVICQVRWLGPSVAEDVAPEYVSERPGTTARSLAFDEVLSVPDGATSAEVSLLLQWSPGAEVAFRALSLAPASLPPPRPVRIATVYWRPTERSTPAENAAYEKARDVVYNSAFVINRDGGLAGAYRKVQVPVGEVEAGLSAGAAFAPIDLDFGRVGLRAQTWKGIGDGTVVHEVDLARKTRRPWVGDWRSAALKQRRTDAYRGLLDERPR
jgi:hypothetical protein